MPINLERPLINSNLDSYLGEAGTGVGPNVPRMSMWRQSWGLSGEEQWQRYFGQVGLFPSEAQSQQRRGFGKWNFSHHLILVPAMDRTRLQLYHTTLMIYFTVTLERMSSELGFTPNSPKPDPTDPQWSSPQASPLILCVHSKLELEIKMGSPNSCPLHLNQK